MFISCFFFLKYTATTEIYTYLHTLSLHDALPIYRQHLETVFMLPTFACGVEEGLKHDIEATMASVHAFNLWLDEDWGFERPDGRFVSDRKSTRLNSSH